MKLTHYSDLGLRLLMYLALRQGGSATIQEASERFAVSKNHLVKVSHQLTKSGLIASSRGRNGGIRLARAAREITVEQALRATEDHFDLVECFDGGANRGGANRCAIADSCRLGGVLEAALQAFFGVLRQTTLADLVENGTALELRLAQPVPAPVGLDGPVGRTLAG